MGLSIDRLVYSPSQDSEGSKVASYLKDASGNLLTSQANGSQQALDVGINVAGVQVDPRQIRALTSADTVTADQGGTWNINNISGTISLPTGASTSANQATEISHLASIDTSNAAIQADLDALKKLSGSAWTSGDAGIQALAKDSSGNYAPLNLDASGALKVDATVTNPVPDTAVKSSAVSVATTATALPTTALASRKHMFVENVDTKSCELGAASVTYGTGLRLSAGSVIDFDLGPDVTLYGIANTGTVSVRVLEIA